MQAVRYTDKPVFEVGIIEEQMHKTAGQAGALLASVKSSITRLATIRPAAESDVFTVSPVPTQPTGEVPGSNTLPIPTAIPAVPTTGTIPSGTPTITPIADTEPTTQPNAHPTNQPKPTKVPKPTAVPKLELQARRPGNSFDEVTETVSPIMCVPKPLLWAILHNEYGPWLPKVEADWDNLNTMKGSDTTAVSGSTSVMGVTQMMGDTWYRVKPYVMAKFTVSDMSLSVTFDSIAAAGFHLRNVSLAGQDHQPCDDWDVKYILYAACRYNGACPANTFGQSQYYNQYTYDVCAAYNRYTSGKQKSCK